MEAALRILGLQPGEISDTDTLVSLGMDSMQMVEVRQLPSKTQICPQIIHDYSCCDAMPDTSSEVQYWPPDSDRITWQ